MNFIGQKRLVAQFNNYDIINLPRTLLFLGENGCGKHTFTKYLAKKFLLDIVEIKEAPSSDDLIEYMHKTINTFYVIDLGLFPDKSQNQFLKFIEEPTKTVFIALLATSDTEVLPTILNRCNKFTFESYSQAELQQITLSEGPNDPEAYKIFKTPGKLRALTVATYQALMDLAEKIVYKINLAHYGNTLSLCTKINCKDLYDRVDFELLLDAVEYLALEAFKKEDNELFFNIFTTTVEYRKRIIKKALIKETLLFDYLTKLWEITHDPR